MRPDSLPLTFWLKVVIFLSLYFELMSRPESPKDSPSLSQKSPINLLAVRICLETGPVAELRVVEKKSGESYPLVLNSKQDVCFKRGNSLLLLFGRELDFELDAASWRLVQNCRPGTEDGSETVREQRRMNNAAIMEGLNRMFEDRHKDIRRVGRLELYAKPKRRFLHLYRTIMTYGADNLRCWTEGHANLPRNGLKTVYMVWHHRNARAAVELQRKLTEMGFQVRREGNLINFSDAFSDSEIEYALKNTSLKECME